VLAAPGAPWDVELLARELATLKSELARRDHVA
jgi:hypothetical protein